MPIYSGPDDLKQVAAALTLVAIDPIYNTNVLILIHIQELLCMLLRIAVGTTSNQILQHILATTVQTIHMIQVKHGWQQFFTVVTRPSLTTGNKIALDIGKPATLWGRHGHV